MAPSTSKMSVQETLDNMDNRFHPLPLPLTHFKHFEDFFLSEEYSDMKIICGDTTFPAHRIAVCTNSTWFKNACCSGFNESSGLVQLQEMDPLVFQRVLEFLYKREYSLDGVAMDACTPIDKTSPSVCTFGKRKSKNKDPPAAHAPSDQRPQKRLKVSISEITGTDKKIDPSIVAEPPNPGPFAGPFAGLYAHAPPVPGPSVAEPSVTHTASHKVEKWPPLVTCPPSYFHARVFGDADFFLLEELKEQALAKFRVSLRSIDELWKVKLLISELWSKNEKYAKLRPILMGSILFSHSKAHTLFQEVTQDFLESQPEFNSDFCLSIVNSSIWEPSRQKGQISSPQ
ncbi:hypothetical protein N7540_002869 [Penicillium herquei]|nr:hypothetical protein N7540_002869 [Penicillium herquei]